MYQETLDFSVKVCWEMSLKTYRIFDVSLANIQDSYFRRYFHELHEQNRKQLTVFTLDSPISTTLTIFMAKNIIKASLLQVLMHEKLFRSSLSRTAFQDINWNFLSASISDEIIKKLSFNNREFCHFQNFPAFLIHKQVLEWQQFHLENVREAQTRRGK